MTVLHVAPSNGEVIAWIVVRDVGCVHRQRAHEDGGGTLLSLEVFEAMGCGVMGEIKPVTVVDGSPCIDTLEMEVGRMKGLSLY